MKKEWMELDGVGQAALIASGEISALELVDAALERIEQINPRINALVSTAPEAAREKARSELSGPLAGVPFLIKDLLAYPGQRYTLGSRLFSQNVPTEGSPYTQQLDGGGLISLGKSTTSEFGLLGSTESLLSGVTQNPWDPTKSVAGSSGGAAAAVASGMVALAHASDGGGSIRIPASVCGLFGFKPGRGRCVSNGQSTPVDIIIEHCVSRSVRDSALILSITEQKQEPVTPVGYVDRPLDRKLQIGFYTETLTGGRPTPAVMSEIERTAALCEDLGHEVIPAPPPPVDGKGISDAFFTIAGAGLSHVAQSLKATLGRPVGPDDFEPFTLELIDWFRTLPDNTLPETMEACQRIETQMREYLARYDVALCPTVPIEPWANGWLAPDLGRELIIERTELIAGYTPVHNIAGVPAMSVPLGWGSEGPLVGSHFAAGQGMEATLLGLAYQLEEAAPWAHRYRDPMGMGKTDRPG